VAQDLVHSDYVASIVTLRTRFTLITFCAISQFWAEMAWTFGRSLWIGDHGRAVRKVCFWGTRVILGTCRADFKSKEGAPRSCREQNQALHTVPEQD
jgi:hypothetical protein